MSLPNPLTQCENFIGPLIHLKAFGQHIIVLNSAQVASDLLDKKSSIYSDRPPLVMVSFRISASVLRAAEVSIKSSEVLCGGKAMPLIPYGDV